MSMNITKKSITKMLAAALLTGVFVACNNQPPASQNQVATPVSVEELKPSSISKLVNTTGTVQPVYGVELSSQMSGEYRLQTNPATGKPFKMGDKVAAGQEVIRLDDKEYEIGVSIEVKKLNLELAEREVTKQKELYEKGGVTQLEVRNSELKALTARQDVETATLNLAKMSVRAPFAGVIVNLPYYTAGVRVNTGSVMLGVMAYSQMYMEINMPESLIGYIHQAQPVKISHYTLPDDTLKGIINELSPAISSETRTFKGKILIDNPELKLRPGMFVKADVVIDKAEGAIIIPKEVIQSSRERKYVYIVENNLAVRRDIATGIENEDMVQVVKGLKEKDNLVVRGYATLRNNSAVKIQQ